MIRDVLDPERGVLVIEVHDLAKIMDRKEACLFEHEHSIYLNLFTMKCLLEKAGFKLLTSELVSEKECRGNSLLVAAALQNSPRQPDSSVMVQQLAPTADWKKWMNLGRL